MKKLLTIFSLMVWMFTGTAQTGANCTDAIPFNTGNCKSEQILNTDFIWYKFTATQATQRIEFRKQNGSSGHVHMMSLLKGDCIAPLKLDSVKSTPANDSLLVLDETTLITGEIYYIVLSRSSGSCTECTGDVFYDLCLQEVPQYQICASLMDGSMYNCCDFGDECVLLTVCPGTEILLSVSNTFGAFGVSWSIPGGTPSAGVGNPITVSFASPGLYLCTYVVSGTTTTTGSGYINVIPGPVNTDFTFQNPVCVGSEVCFTNISDPPNDNNGVATWNYGNGTIQYPSPCTMLECFCTTYESPGTYTVSLSVNSGCPATVAHEIEVIEPSISISTAAVCLGSASVFTIDYECFDPADIISYSWNFGDGSPAGTTSNPSHIYSSLGVYNVTLIVTDVNGNTYNAATTAAVDPPPAITAIASNYNIPSGCSSTLSASPASGISYQWQPSGLTGTNVTVNPTSTTTYTVTGTTTNGCISTATVTVNIIVPFTITGNTSACAGMSTYSVVSDITSGVSYTWTTTTGLSGSGSSANINFGLTGGGTVTFTGTYSGGCTYSASLYVGACCQVEGSIPPFYDALSSEVLAPYGTLSGGVLTVTNQTFSINGHFTVNQNLILSGCDIRMGYLAQIKIDPGVTLKITSNGLTDKTHIYACKEMWDGIYITHSNAKLLVDNGSTIEDAISAIVSHWEGNYQITSNAVYGNVIFNKNYKTLVVTNPLSGVHPGYITSSTIQCYDGVTGGNPASNGHKLRFPHSGKRSAVGAEITNMEKITIGDPLLPIYTNTFDNLDFGVRTYNSNVNVYNNNFINITAPAIPGKKEECNTGTAICATGNPSVSVTRILNVGDVAGGYYINNFTNCFKGVAITQNHSAFVWKNIFTNIGSTAVRASLNYSRSIV
jgi:hypothetical protein